MLLCGFSLFLVGPSPVLPDSLVLMAAGQMLIGALSVYFLIT